MNIKKTECTVVNIYYAFWLFIAVLLLCEAVVRWNQGKFTQLDYSAQSVIFVNLVFCLYIPLIGLYLQYKKYDVSYIFLGISLAYFYHILREIIFLPDVCLSVIREHLYLLNL